MNLSINAFPKGSSWTFPWNFFPPRHKPEESQFEKNEVEMLPISNTEYLLRIKYNRVFFIDQQL